jgi:glycosyltransferase involved in cell wall biosynthesis
VPCFAAVHPVDPPRNGPFTFALVCRLEPWKQADMVIAATARVLGIRVLIAGTVSAERRLREQARRLGVADRIVFRGYQADPRPVVAESHAAINSSRDEPLGLSVLEALAMQRAVVAFAGGGIPEIVRDGETGWLIRERSVAALAAGLAAASSDPARAAILGGKARAFVAADATIDAMCRGYGRAYAALFGNQSGSTA